MKWINAVLAMLLLSPTLLGDELLTLTSPNKGSLSNNQQYGKIAWLDDDEKWLQSWKLSCNVQFGMLQGGDNNLFYSRGISSNGMFVADTNKGVIVGVTEQGELYVKCNGVKEELEHNFSLTQNEIYTLSIEFRTWFANTEDSIVSGSLYVTLGGATIDMQIDTVDKIDNCFLRNEKVYSDTAYPMLCTDLKHTFTDIKLYKLENHIIPEPSSVVLLSLSLLVFASRRRRR